jgi:hypothetical protein
MVFDSYWGFLITLQKWEITVYSKGFWHFLWFFEELDTPQKMRITVYTKGFWQLLIVFDKPLKNGK